MNEVPTAQEIRITRVFDAPRVQPLPGGRDDADVVGHERVVGQRRGRHRDHVRLPVDARGDVAGRRRDEVLGLHAVRVGDHVAARAVPGLRHRANLSGPSVDAQA